MTERRIVPLAYVTKWSATRGIVVVMDAKVTRLGALSGSGTSLYVSPAHWTDDLDVAEKRLREAVTKAHKAAQKKATALRNLLDGPAQYEKGKA